MPRLLSLRYIDDLGRMLVYLTRMQEEEVADHVYHLEAKAKAHGDRNFFAYYPERIERGRPNGPATEIEAVSDEAADKKDDEQFVYYLNYVDQRCTRFLCQRYRLHGGTGRKGVKSGQYSMDRVAVRYYPRRDKRTPKFKVKNVAQYMEEVLGVYH